MIYSIGLAVLILAGIAAGLLGLGILYMELADRRERRRQRIFNEGSAWARASIAYDARWFSEDQATEHAIRGMAQGNDPMQVREGWRRMRDQAPADGGGKGSDHA